MSQLSDFYNLEGPDTMGRMLVDIWDWDDEKLEMEHDFIQWLFPLREESNYNPYAPILTDDDIDSIQLENVRYSFIRMCDFYGIEFRGATIVKSPNTWIAKSAIWLTPGNHNFLRLTRIMKSLTFFGLDQQAVTLELFLLDLYNGNESIIGETTLKFWKEAAQ